MVYKSTVIAMTVLIAAAQSIAAPINVCHPHPRGTAAGLIACIHQGNQTEGMVIDLEGERIELNVPYRNDDAGLPAIRTPMAIKNGHIFRNPDSQFNFRLMTVVEDGVLDLSHVTMEYGFDTSDDGGGAIFVHEPAVLNSIDNCTFSFNASDRGGGAIRAQGNGDGAVLITSITNSTFNGNQSADFSGGAIDIRRSHAYLIANSTFFGNEASNFGGAISIHQAGLSYLVNSTISGNFVDDCGNGGGVALREAGIENLISTIISGNNPGCAQNTSRDVYTNDAGVGTELNNLIGTNAGNGFTASPPNGPNANGSFIGDSTVSSYMVAGLEPLEWNGGHTQTMALLTNSIAIGNGANPFGYKHDQRGHHFHRETDGLTDIGAYQVQERHHHDHE